MSARREIRDEDSMTHMITRRQFITALTLAALGGCRTVPGLRSQRRVTAPARACCWVDGLCPQTIAVVGDVQRTGLIELTTLGRTQNDLERETVLEAIAREKPDMLLMLGDQVVLGDDDNSWVYFDNIMDPIHTAGIPVRAILGNHDYEGRDHHNCIEQFCRRFPHQRERRHGLIDLGGVALLTVDSNLDQLSRAEAEEQENDYRAMLEKLDADPSVRAVIVASHHPPYTNSDLFDKDDIRAVERVFARPFLRASKTRLYLSGHVHSYERFVIGEKTFVVSGGGGGPRREVDISAGRPYTNDAYRGDDVRPFHYLLLKIHQDKITVETKMLRLPRRTPMPTPKFLVGDRFALRVAE